MILQLFLPCGVDLIAINQGTITQNSPRTTPSVSQASSLSLMRFSIHGTQHRSTMKNDDQLVTLGWLLYGTDRSVVVAINLLPRRRRRLRRQEPRWWCGEFKSIYKLHRTVAVKAMAPSSRDPLGFLADRVCSSGTCIIRLGWLVGLLGGAI